MPKKLLIEALPEILLLFFVVFCCFLLVFVGFCWFLLVFVGFCWFLLVFVGFCWFLLVFVGFCWFLLVFVGFCWFFQTFSDWGKWLSKVLKKDSEFLSPIKKKIGCFWFLKK